MREWERYLLAHQERHLADLVHFLRIPSVSGTPDVDRAADWVAQRLTSAGLEHVQVTHPVVYGDWLHAPGKPATP